jgi:hypothetical protein
VLFACCSHTYIGQERQLRQEAHVVKPRNRGVAGASPYTPQNVDAAITHLEHVLGSAGADSLFAQSYWRGRVLQAFATPGLMRTQQERLQRLLDRIAFFS